MKLLLLFFLLIVGRGQGSFHISNIFTDYVVLQWDGPPNLYGTGDPGAEVKILTDGPNGRKTFHGAVKQDGTWKLALPGFQASLDQYTITLTSGTNPAVTLHNATFGDVFVCSGQSNMRFVTCQSFNGSKEVAEANNPHVRVFTVSEKPSPKVPLHNLTSYGNTGWQPANPKSVGDGHAFTIFSAVCWYYGRDLFKLRGGKTPIGLLSTVIGGTPLQAWSSPDVLKKCGVEGDAPPPKVSSLPHIYDHHPHPSVVAAEYCKGGDPHPHNYNVNSALWNGMVVPILSFSIKGILWYQGENNHNQAPLYAKCFPVMIESWQTSFPSKTGKVPFMFVQLAATPDSHFVALRFAQAHAYKVHNLAVLRCV